MYKKIIHKLSEKFPKVSEIDVFGLHEKAGDFLIVTDNSLVIRDANFNFLRKLGFTSRDDVKLVLGHSLCEFIDLALCDELEECEGDGKRRGEMKNLVDEEIPIYIESVVSLARNSAQKVIGKVVILKDITDLQVRTQDADKLAKQAYEVKEEAEKAKKELEEQWMNAPNGQLKVEGWDVKKVNDAITNLLGYKAYEFVGKGLLKAPFMTRDAREELLRIGSFTDFEGRVSDSCELKLKHKNESDVWVKAVFNRERRKDGTIFTDVSFHDHTQEKQDAEQIQQLMDQLKIQATTDYLTELLNRGAFIEQFNGRSQEQDRRAEKSVLLMFDIDHFKNINDTYGHNIGDDVLKAFSKILQESVREGAGDIVGRLGGEEFVIYLTNIDEAKAEDIAKRILNKTKDLSLKVGEDALKVTVSAGIALRKKGEGFDDLSVRADKALYYAKASGRDRVCQAAPVGQAAE